ncbi:AzlD domain-containing protein [Actinotignum schaalii]|uniref:AzlD domain-containing protein n=1 Tax=Actinotignum schaalii TaxID=59505 RepID=UPI0003FAA025|nr:AzlD domain-containing protein [Actinotignum schaalii]AIE82267.1 branched-chain amino acid transporter AzlD [Actinotignum schaalii]WQN44300.1 AzlD domain-containing protein [Actinotignum schaalii]
MTGYLLAVLLGSLALMLCLRGVPFLILHPLRRSHLVRALSAWLPVGVLVILALAMVRNEVLPVSAESVLRVGVASAVTILAHELSGRRMLVSLAAGTLTYIGLLAI